MNKIYILQYLIYYLVLFILVRVYVHLKKNKLSIWVESSDENILVKNNYYIIHEKLIFYWKWVKLSLSILGIFLLKVTIN